MAWAAVIGGASALVSGAISSSSANKSRDAASNAANNALAQLQSIGLPPDLSGQIVLKEFQKAGTLTPELEKQISAGQSQMAGVKGNAQAQQAQQSALQALQERGKTGFTLQEQAQMNTALGQAQRDENAKQQQIVQQMQSRGMGTGGAELAAALQESQSGANRESEQALNVAAQGQQRALSAISQGGQLGGQMEQQAFGEQSQKAQAQDAFNKLSYQQQVAAQQQNVAAQNQAQQLNLNNAQQLSNMNAAQTNQEQLRQKQAQQQYWNSRLAQAGGQAQADLQGSNIYSNIAKQQAGQAATIATGVGGLVQGGINAYNSSNQNGNSNTTQAQNSSSNNNFDPNNVSGISNWDPNNISGIST